jgi:serine/threonine protein kinase
VLSTSEDLYSLNERIDLAKILASSVVYVHSSRFVHKNIRPETIVVFDNNTSPIGAVFLIGFENFRPEGGQTFLASDSLWEKDLYRHPTRQGLRPQEEYIMQHDIYSLGVTLLEIGLWTSFVIELEGSTELTPAPELDIAGHLTERNPRKRAAGIKGSLIEAAERRLPSKMGQKYTNIVLSCLTCLDNTHNGFGDEDDFMDKDGILVGVRYIENVRMSGIYRNGRGALTCSDSA